MYSCDVGGKEKKKEREREKETHASREVPKRRLHLGSGCKGWVRGRGSAGRGKGWKEAACRSAHLSIHLDGLGLLSSAPPRPEWLPGRGARPPGIPVRPQPQLARVALHHEEAPVLGQGHAATVQSLRPAPAESSGGQQRDQGK